jgi:hypothetical protein
MKLCHKHRTVKRNGYCLRCKADTERIRYERDPQLQRTRKKNEYHSKRLKKDTEQRMASKPCGHDDALAVEESDKHPDHQGSDDQVFFCPDCGQYIDAEGKTVADPTEAKASASQAGKAPSPSAPSAKRAYKRDTTTMVMVKCSWKNCPSPKFPLYPQNVRDKNWCPKIHRPMIKERSNRERQQKFRAKHGNRS